MLNLDYSLVWCWRRQRLEKVNSTDRVKSEILRVQEEGKVLHTTKRRKVKFTGHILHRNCFYSTQAVAE
jgi:hypothetical protein